MPLYFFERITATDFVGPVIIAASDEPEAWRTLARREGGSERALRDDDWMIALELAAIPPTAAVVYPAPYRNAVVR